MLFNIFWQISPRAKLTTQEIQTVQNLIERCIQIYMNQSEVVTALQLQAQVDPDFTTLGSYFLHSVNIWKCGRN